MIITQPVDDTECRAALVFLVDQPDLSDTELDRHVDTLLRHADRYRFSLEQCLIARESGRIVASCLAVDAPGRTTSLFLPGRRHFPHIAQAVARLIDEACSKAYQRNVQLIQAIIPPDADHEAELYRQAGFRHLAELIYLETDLTQPIAMNSSVPSLKYTTYNAETHALFSEVIEATYEGSMDCGSLNGARDIEDILASHRATGLFDANRWLVGFAEERPVGAVLLAENVQHRAWEVVYVGLLPAWRRQGYGQTLLCHAIQFARDAAATQMTATVDARNKPARGLYARFGFVELFRRSAWIKLLGQRPEVKSS